jgi:hypothetical protein
LAGADCGTSAPFSWFAPCHALIRAARDDGFHLVQLAIAGLKFRFQPHTQPRQID